jgi:hypothetical protein
VTCDRLRNLSCRVLGWSENCAVRREMAFLGLCGLDLLALVVAGLRFRRFGAFGVLVYKNAAPQRGVRKTNRVEPELVYSIVTNSSDSAISTGSVSSVGR